eukprot:35834_1
MPASAAKGALVEGSKFSWSQRSRGANAAARKERGPGLAAGAVSLLLGEAGDMERRGWATAGEKPCGKSSALGRMVASGTVERRVGCRMKGDSGPVASKGWGGVKSEDMNGRSFEFGMRREEEEAAGGGGRCEEEEDGRGGG